MMKRIAILTFSLLMLAHARGDYIFLWNVDVGDGEKVTFSYARMYYGSGSDLSTYAAANIAENDSSGKVVASAGSYVAADGGASKEGDTTTKDVWSYLGADSPNSKSFYFEIYDYLFASVGTTKLFSFSDYGATPTGDRLDLSSHSGATPFTVTEGMFNVPEPSSALLMLLGLVGLALKRKHVNSKHK